MLLALLTAVAALALPRSAGAQAEPAAGGVTIVVMPAGTTLEDFGGLDNAAVGLLGAALGDASPAQFYLDISQGARINGSLYDEPLPDPLLDTGVLINPAAWDRVEARAAAAPADLVPGLLATTLDAAGIEAGVADADVGEAGLIVVHEDGAILPVPGEEDCAPCVTVRLGTAAEAAELGHSVPPGELVVAFAAPPASGRELMPLAIWGAGKGTIRSPSTRFDGYALPTDLAPTILGHFGLAVPSEMTGRALEVEPGTPDLAALEGLGDRLDQIAPRRTPVIAQTLLIWLVLAVAVLLLSRGRAWRPAIQVLTLSAIYLIPLLLLAAALEPSLAVERAGALILPPALALATFALAPPLGGLAIACAVAVGAVALDVVAGSHLTRLSLLGPNPAGGVRFFGIGNELEAIVAVLTLAGTGAALDSRQQSRPSPRACAIAFALVGLIAVAAFAPGRFGADVGAAIGIPAGVAVAIAVLLNARGRILLAILLAPLAALAALAAADLVLGGDAHLARSVLDAGGLEQLGDVAERRLRLCAASFRRYADDPVLWASVGLIAAGVWRRRELWSGLEPVPAMRAALAGAAAATMVGTLANDSGVQLLIIGTVLVTLCLGVAWVASQDGGQAARRPEADPRS